MGSFISIIKAIIAILPILRELITAAEVLFPAQGAGVQKLELVKTLLQNAYNAATEIEAPFASIWPTVASVIGYVVPLITKPTAPAIAVSAAQVYSSVVNTTPAQVESLAAQVTPRPTAFPSATVQLASDA